MFFTDREISTFFFGVNIKKQFDPKWSLYSQYIYHRGCHGKKPGTWFDAIHFSSTMTFNVI